MASGTWKLYGKFMLSLLNKECDFDSDTLKLMHTSASHVPDQDAHRYKSDLSNEVTGTNLAAGGVALTSCTAAYTAATNTVKITCADYSVATATATGIKNSHIYDSSPGSDATRPLIAYVVWDVELAPSAATLAITFDPTTGIASGTVA
jgi:hypothetical protein